MDGQRGGSKVIGSQPNCGTAGCGAWSVGEAVPLILDHAVDIAPLAPPGELDALVQFFTDVGYATDARRQEWVLLADVFGLSAGVGQHGTARADGRRPTHCLAHFTVPMRRG